MPLDSNFYRLLLQRQPDDEGSIQLQSDQGEVHYLVKVSKQSLELQDPLTHVVLGRLHAVEPKRRSVQLFNPDLSIELTNKSYFSWHWSAAFEAHHLSWKRSSFLTSSERGYELFAGEKNELAISLLRYKPGFSKGPGEIEFFDHNIARLHPPLQDAKGFEVAVLLCLLSFVESIEAMESTSTTQNKTEQTK